jgi:hypothetical protein
MAQLHFLCWTQGRQIFILSVTRRRERDLGTSQDGPGKSLLGTKQKEDLKQWLLEPSIFKVGCTALFVIPSSFLSRPYLGHQE